MYNILLPILVVLPMMGGLLVALLRPKTATARTALVLSFLGVEACLALLTASQSDPSLRLFSMTDRKSVV